MNNEYKLIYTKKALKFLDKHLDIEEQIINVMILIANNPFSKDLDQYDIRSLSGYNDCFRLKIKKYRVIYKILQNELIICVIDIDSRGNVYKSLNQKLK